MRYLRLLGPVQVVQTASDQHEEKQSASHDRTPRFRSRRTVALLGYLAAEGRPMAREHLALLFWPDEEPGAGRGNLRRELYNLAKILPDCWQTDSQTVAFAPSAQTTVDIYTLQRLEQQRRWRDAAELLGGEFLEGIHLSDNLRFETWLLAERERWQMRSQAVLNHACDELTGRGLYNDALGYVRLMLQNTSWDEATHRKAMRLLMWTGQREAALRQFEICRQALEEELGVEPSRETRKLRQQIQRKELEDPPLLPAFVAQATAKRDEVTPAFVARERELAQLNGCLEEAMAGHGQVVFITGEPGRGKTALMDAFAREALAAYPDLLVAQGRCDAYSGAGDAYSPFRDVMTMLTGDVEARWSAGTISSELAQRLWIALPLIVQALLEHGTQLLNVLVPGPSLLARAMIASPIEASWLPRLKERVRQLQQTAIDAEQAAHIHEQFTNVLCKVAEQRPLLLFIDDLQWIDVASNGLLYHLGRRLSDVKARIMIVCAYRPTEIVRDVRTGRHLLAKLLSEFKRTFGDVWFSLNWEDESEGRRFVDAMVDIEPNHLAQKFRNKLFQRTRGHPLFTIELLRTMQERGDLVKDGDGFWQEGVELDWQVLPARVEAVIEERIQQLEPDLQDIMRVASIEGELFTAQVVAHARNMGEETILRRLAQDLERRYQLVQEQEETPTGRRNIVRYRFSHALFQEYLYGQLGRGERRLIHKAVAAALENVYAEETDAMAVQLARHYDQAGEYGSALRYYVLAAKQAAAIHANDEAITHYTRAIALSQHAAAEDVETAELRRGRGAAFSTVGQFDQAHKDLESALEMAQPFSTPRLEWGVLIDLGKLWASRDYGQAHRYFERALEVARRVNDPEALASSLNWMGNWYANNEEPAKALSHHRQAMHIFSELDDRPNLANTLDLLGIAHLLAGDFEASVESYNRGITLFRESGNLPRLASSLMGRAVTATAPAFLTLLPGSDSSDPISDFQSAVEIAQKIGSFSDEAWSMWPLGLLFAVHGNLGQALESSRRGLEMASKIEHREWIVGNHFALGVLYSELLAPEAARQQLDRGLALARELDSRYWINHMSGALAKTLLLLGELSEAQNCLEIVLSDDTPMDTTGKRYCWARKAELALAQREAALALDIANRLIASAAGMRPGRVITFLWLLKAEASAVLGRMEEAFALLRQAIDHGSQTEQRLLLWRLHASLARLHQASGQVEEAAQALSMARALVEDMATTIPDKELGSNFRSRALAALSTSARL